MATTDLKPCTLTEPKTERPGLYKVIPLNDDFTPREFVVTVLKAVFRMTEADALGVMLTAHKRGTCVMAVYTKEVTETKADEGTDRGRRQGYLRRESIRFLPPNFRRFDLPHVQSSFFEINSLTLLSPMGGRHVCQV